MNKIATIFEQSGALKRAIASDKSLIDTITRAGELLHQTKTAGGTIFACGNGGSSCDAMHLVEELVARYKSDRPGIRAQHLVDPSVLTCWANDHDFSEVFERQVTTFMTPRDVLVAISTSGQSKNVIKAVRAARAIGANVVGLLGKGGGALAPLCNEAIVVPSNDTERIQEVHITIIHAWCERFE